MTSPEQTPSKRGVVGGLLDLASATISRPLQAAQESKLGKAAALGVANLGISAGAAPEKAEAAPIPDLVVYDTSTDSSNFANTEIGAANFILEPGGSPSTVDAGASLMFTGNGQAIDQLEVIYQYGTQSGPNQGNVAALSWAVAMYLNPADYTAEGLAGVPGFTAPDYYLELADPMNADYLDVINTSGVINNHRAMIDLSDLGISDWYTIDGQEHLAFLTPFSTGNTGTLSTGIALSDNSGFNVGIMEGLYDDITSGGPDTYLNYGYSYGNGAGRVTTQAIPEPGSIGLMAVGLGILAGGRLLGRTRREEKAPEA